MYMLIHVTVGKEACSPPSLCGSPYSHSMLCDIVGNGGIKVSVECFILVLRGGFPFDRATQV